MVQNQIRGGKIFQLTHSRGVRLESWCVLIGIIRNFNSRTHVECDLRDLIQSMLPCDFNSRTHVECDQKITRTVQDVLNFNSRTHVECDTVATAAPAILIHFNSRTHVECD